jgi:2-polyprenyl-3-methyl-5-hydroxy-6-metoxy-1,4-benzoquinol methylase
MNNPNPQDTAEELKYQARQAAAFDQVRPTPAETIRRYREHRNWRTSRKEFVFYSIRKHAPVRICNFGCGAGETSTELAALGYHVSSYDLSPELIALARRRAELDQVADRAHFFVGDVLTMDPPEEKFDLVLVEAVLHHLVDVRQALEGLARWLKPGGVVVIEEPIAFSPWLQRLRDRSSVPKDISPNERQLYPADIALIEQQFKIEEKRYFHLFARLLRLAGENSWLAHPTRSPFYWLDYLILSCLPFLRKYAGIIVIIGRKTGG